MKKIILMVGLSMMLTNCAKDEISDPVISEATPTLMTIGAQIAAEEESRATLDESNRIVWHENDKIGLYVDDNTAQYEFTLSGDAYQTTGIFTGEGVTGEKYYAYYPYSETDSGMTSGKTLTIPLATMQPYEANGFAQNINPMYAVGNDPQALVFKNLCGVMKLQLTGDALLYSIKVEALDASGEEGKTLSGRGNVYANTESLSNTSYTFGSTSYHYKTNYVKLTDINVQLDPTTPQPFYLVVPAGDYNTSGGSLVITIETDKGSMIKTTTTQFTVNRSKIRPFTAFEVVPDGIENATATYYGTANCIEMAPDQTAVEVDCMPYYTLSETFIYQATSSATQPKAASAALLWCDTKENLVSVSLDTDAQKLRVTKAAGDTGNAVVAIYDDAGTILWSFHIWAHETYADKRAVAADGTVYQMMDLNLGAMSNSPDAASAGLYYQWGRKDPFPSIDETGSTVTTYGTAWPTDGGTTSSMEYAVQNPMTLITAGRFHWFKSGIPEAKSYWGNPYQANSSNPLPTKGVKTIYDPCPAGYRVAPENLFVNIQTSGTFSMGWNIAFGDGEASFFPAAGRRTSVTAVTYAGTRGYYAGNALKAGGSSWLPFLYLTSTSCEYDSNSYGKNALSVRCVKEV